MIGLVMAAGASRRLRPDTDHLPKTLLPVDGDVTILDIALRNLPLSGLTDVVVIVGYAAAAVAERVPELERRHSVALELVHNDRAEEWNNAYSLWSPASYLRRAHPRSTATPCTRSSVERTLLAARRPGRRRT